MAISLATLVLVLILNPASSTESEQRECHQLTDATTTCRAPSPIGEAELICCAVTEFFDCMRPFDPLCDHDFLSIHLISIRRLQDAYDEKNCSSFQCPSSVPPTQMSAEELLERQTQVEQRRRDREQARIGITPEQNA